MNWKLKNNNIGTRNNIIKIDARNDIDQMLIEEEKVKLDDTNNLDNLEMLVAVKTGGEGRIVTLISAICLSIFISGIYLIKKYVI